MALINCPECGKQISDQAPSCPYCGYTINRELTYNSNLRNKTAAALFGIFLGSFGAHKFYLGQTTTGLCYLLFCWTGLPPILGFIEGLIYLSYSDKQFDIKYNS